MKKLLMIIASAILISGCHNYQADVDALQKENQSLANAATYKDSTISNFMGQFNDIEKNLSSIEELQARISETSKTPELKSTQVERINADIAAINDLMKQNKEKIASLTKKLKSSNYKLAGLEKTIASLNEQLVDKDRQLSVLNERLTALNSTVEKLNTDVATLNTLTTGQKLTIEEQTTSLHTAYFTTGTYKDLEAKKVVMKKGGVLGIGKTKTVTADFDKTNFNTIDITKTASIPLETHKADILTNHPSDSYKLEHDPQDKDEVTNLVITNPDRFWRSSKYLVVVVDK